MKRLFTQFIFEWRSNLWLVIELVIVSAALWFSVDYMSTWLSIRFENPGWDTSSTFNVSVATIDSEHPSYKVPATKPGETEAEAFARELSEGFESFSERLGAVDGVEFVAYASTHPHSYNFSGNGVEIITVEGNDTILRASENYYGNNVIRVSGDFAQVFRIKGSFGETPAQLDSILNERQTIVTQNLFPQLFPEGKGLSHHIISRLQYDDNVVIGAVIPTFKRVNYEKAMHATVLAPGHYDFRYGFGLVVRVSPEKADGFIDDIRKNHPELRQLGNYRISNIESLDDIAASLDKEQDVQLYSWGICILFLLVTVFLGLLGSFWFRTSQRVGEIAIRKVNGATSLDILKRLCGEGLIMLLFSIPFSAALVWLFVEMELVGAVYYYNDTYVVRIILEYVAVIVMTALTIIAGIWFPARKAMNVEPANILRGE